ncbi:sugar phosphate isomerase/epimerase [Verrucomicrobiales bacterium]|nr:sugar phosphate isomerase/epimerase [Verrucomicrobiales bacterium]
MKLSRRHFLTTTLAAAPAYALADHHGETATYPFEISLAQWSLHKMIFDGKLQPLDFPTYTKSEFDISAVEYVNQFFMDKATDAAFLADLKKRCSDAGVKSLLIMCDREGALGDADTDKRTKAVDNHKKWVEAAKTLGCHSIRVNASSGGTFEEQQERAADGLRQLSEFAAPLGINVIVENHGGLSSDGSWLAGTIKKVGLDNCGTLPDFGNFKIAEDQYYDRYKGVTELMPSAKGVSAKSNEFDDQGNETKTDFAKMLKIVNAAGYTGHIGIEYEGKKLSEPEGILATKLLLERFQKTA